MFEGGVRCALPLMGEVSALKPFLKGSCTMVSIQEFTVRNTAMSRDMSVALI